jgi:hypothetical protein
LWRRYLPLQPKLQQHTQLRAIRLQFLRSLKSHQMFHNLDRLECHRMLHQVDSGPAENLSDQVLGRYVPLFPSSRASLSFYRVEFGRLLVLVMKKWSMYVKEQRMTNMDES